MKPMHLLFILTFFLVGCASATPTPLPTLEVPTASSATPVPVSTATEAPTATALPSVLPATSTPGAQAAALPLAAPCTAADQVGASSPNQTWKVFNCLGDDPEAGLLTKFVRPDGSATWSLSFKEAFLQPYRPEAANQPDLLQTAFIPVRWTKNEDFVYLTVQTANSAGLYPGADGLFRLDLSTGKLRAVLKPAAAPLSTTYAFKFSPGGNKLAYINQAVQPVTLVILETGTGTEQKITLDARFTQGGSLLWSPDEKELLISVLETGQNGGHALIRYNLETQENVFILQQSARPYRPLEWLWPNTLYAEIDPGQWVYLDLLTQTETTAPAPTPLP
jgi:hypothetical protein